MQAKVYVHIFMDCCLAVAVPSAFQIGRHAVVPVYSIVAVVDLFDLLFGHDTSPAGVSGSYSRHSGRFPVCATASGCRSL